MNTVPRLIDTFTPKHYDLSLTLERAERVFSGTVRVQGTAKNDDIISLHAKDLDILSVTVNGQASTWQLLENDELKIAFDGPVSDSLDVLIDFSGKITDAMHGLYPCYFEVDGIKKELLATQFESHHAREVFPCVDEPEAKSTFDVTLITETDITVLGNMPIKSQNSAEGKLTTSFETTPKMSSYLLAFVVGELQRKTAKTNGGVEVNVYATKAQTSASLDFALVHAVKTIEFFNDFFDIDYPLPKSDHVALPDFSSGAMENWGLVTYREIALLADPATTTLASKEYIATVVSHELSHQWFGNLVTMKWWNDLWLNESFATIMEYLAVDAIHPEYNIMLSFASNESILALRRDAIDGVQPVRVAIHHPDEISTIFDGAIVYAKGARLLAMCRNLIGAEVFRKGLKHYFQKFAYQNTTASDLWDCLSEASGHDVADFMNPWLNQNGYPVLEIQPTKLSQKQFFIGPHQPSSKIWPIPLDAESSEDVPAILDTAELALDIADDERFNVSNSGHYLTKYSDNHLARLLAKLDSFDELSRLQLLNEQTILARGGEISSGNLIDFLDHYRRETSDSVWSIMSLALRELNKFVENDKVAEDKLRNLAADIATEQFTRLGWDKKSGEPEKDTKLRVIILGMMIYSDRSDIIDYCDRLYADGIENIDPEIRALVVSAKVRNSSDQKLISSLFDIYRTTPSADLSDDLAVALTSVKQPALITEILANFSDKNTIRPQDLFRWFAYMIRNRYARTATWQWMVDSWGYIEENFEGDKSYDDFPRYSAAGLVNKQQLDDYRAFFTPMLDEPSLKRNIEIGILEIEGRIELLERDSDAVITKLKSLI